MAHFRRASVNFWSINLCELVKNYPIKCCNNSMWYGSRGSKEGFKRLGNGQESGRLIEFISFWWILILLDSSFLLQVSLGSSMTVKLSHYWYSGLKFFDKTSPGCIIYLSVKSWRLRWKICDRKLISDSRATRIVPSSSSNVRRVSTLTASPITACEQF